MKKTLSLLCNCVLCIGSLLMGCSQIPDVVEETENPVKELKLSTDKLINIVTEGIDYMFDILDGNGDYTAKVLSKNAFGDDVAKVSIEGSKVKVELLSREATIMIADKKQQTATVTISSSNKSLVPTSYGISLENGSNFVMNDVSFGAGKYTVEKIKGNSAEVSVSANDHIAIKSLKPGNSYFKITDHRGTVAKLEVSVSVLHELTSNTLHIQSENDQVSNIYLKYGNGGWQFLSKPESPLIDLITIHTLGDIDKKYDILQINSTAENLQGEVPIYLKDKSGNTATVYFKVRKN